MNKATRMFWKNLGCEEREIFTRGGNPEEDGIYEANILATNMIYKLEVEMLEPTKVFVFDFGSEMYVWSGKNASVDKKKLAVKLAKEMGELGYDYTDWSICPLYVASILGNRPPRTYPRQEGVDRDWALFAKIPSTEKRSLKGDQNGKTVDPSYNTKPCDVAEMLKESRSKPDLAVENLHLGRGDSYFDEETKRLFEFETLEISVWRILENHPEQLSRESIGHFYNSDSYIIKWKYRTTVKGRELSGKPSKHVQAGRDRCVYYCWQGSNASINEKGSAALLTVELDHEKAPQVRVVQGSEPAAFLKLFKGSMVVHDGKREESDGRGKARLFLTRAEVEDEVCLIEVTVWHGSKSSRQKKKVAKLAAKKIIDKRATEFCWSEEGDVALVEVDEGEESEEFLDVVGENREDYVSLLDSDLEYDYTMRLFHLSSVSGTFEATEIVCPHKSEYSSPYPFLQTELYSASQPALFLIDNHHDLWLWQGWWPEREEEAELGDQTGSGAVRWQAERKAAMQTAVNYWQKNHSGDESVPAFLVWAGLEPLEFKNLFPYWIERHDVTELNVKDGRQADAKLSVENELALLLRTTYPLAELLQKPLPEGVDPTHLEIYLSPEDFQTLLSMTKEEFQKLPIWKQTAMKKEKGLF
ncbi:hypothetical protein MTP99_008269 [Tenebrio molitor]|nr:hypothetical protein MTP99_008269 [Tenebrio molitor]